MTRFRIGASLLAVLLALCVWSQLRMSAIQRPIAGTVSRAESYAAREEWTQAAAALLTAQSAWEEHRTLLAVLGDHQPLEDIEGLFARLESYAQEQDKTEFQAACKELNRRILAVKEAQEFNLGSIF